LADIAPLSLPLTLMQTRLRSTFRHHLTISAINQYLTGSLAYLADVSH
jgi:hypothetical protein